jgi:hypothetical protein
MMVALIISVIGGITWSILQIILHSEQVIFSLTKNLVLSVEAVPVFISYPMLAVINIMIVWALVLTVKNTLYVLIRRWRKS